jgi:hypothetical protein
MGAAARLTNLLLMPVQFSADADNGEEKFRGA